MTRSADNKAFAYADGMLFLSEDNGRTWPHSLAFPDAQRITFSHILKNGNILFATGAKLYLSTDNLKTLPADHGEGSGRLGLPPAHAAEPGESPAGTSTRSRASSRGTCNGAEMLVWGNYCNVLGGATPGQHLLLDRQRAHREDRLCLRTESPFSGQRLAGRRQDRHAAGQPRQPGSLPPRAHGGVQPRRKRVLCLHGRCGLAAWGTSATGCEAPTTRRRTSGSGRSSSRTHSNSRYKSGGINFVDGQLYWISDANGPEPYDRGIFRCDPADLDQSREAHAAVQSARSNPET